MWYTLSELPCWKYNSARSVCIVRSFALWVFAFCAAALCCTKNKALPSRPRRFAACAVKAAQFAFIGAKRRALTEEAGGEAQSFGRKGRKGRLGSTRLWP